MWHTLSDNPPPRHTYDPILGPRRGGTHGVRGDLEDGAGGGGRARGATGNLSKYKNKDCFARTFGMLFDRVKKYRFIG